MRMYRGITGVVRRAINNGDLKGKIFISDVISLMPAEKQGVPEKTVRATLNKMSRDNEIHRVHREFYTKDIRLASIQKAVDAVQTTTPKRKVSQNKTVSVSGKLVGTQMVDGRMIANIEVTNLEFK